MKQLILLIVSLCFQYIAFAQSIPTQHKKPSINSDIYSTWPSLQDDAISNDGKYILYTIRLGSIFKGRISKLVLQSTDGLWNLEIEGDISNAQITENSRWVFFMKGKDSLGIAALGSSKIEYIPHVTSISFPTNNNGKLHCDWMTYFSVNPENELVLYNVETRNKIIFNSVTKTMFWGNNLIFETDSIKDGEHEKSLNWYAVNEGKLFTIWSDIEGSREVNNIVFDNSHYQLAFNVSNQSNKQRINSFYYYKLGTDSAKLLLSDRTADLGSLLCLDQITKFSFAGTRLFYTVLERPRTEIVKDTLELKIWSYLDTRLKSYQLKTPVQTIFSFAMNINTGEIIQLTHNGETLGPSPDQNDSLAFISNNKGDPAERNWNPATQIPERLISTIDGTTHWISKKQYSMCTFSPSGKFILYYNSDKMSYFSYEIKSRTTRNITKNALTKWTRYLNDDIDAKKETYLPSCWLANDSAVLLYDQFDIWKIDPTGRHLPKNLTNGYGLKNQISFEIIKSNYGEIVNSDAILLLSAFNHQNKDNGFYKTMVSQKSDPELLSMDHYFYFAPNAAKNTNDGIQFTPQKARDSNNYLIRKMSASESPNYYVTHDFKSFTRLSNLSPELRYNWMTSELHTFKTTAGSFLQGILYKPEDFNPTQKYPVIFYYYEHLSDNLHAYLSPEPSDGRLNIPWYVSNGYLVFEPDIANIRPGYPGEAALNAVVSAAKYLSSFPYVDKKRMGIQGVSYGGFETNYIVTHSNLFAAACSSSGLSDLISGYGSLDGENGRSNENFYELGQFRIGCTLWQRPELYIKNSPIFYADKVKTPLLIMHTTNDTRCPFSNAIELFTALRRLGKPSWMLEYTNGNHAIWDTSADDFSIRMAEFFDHYLKGKPAPKWMSLDGSEKMKLTTNLNQRRKGIGGSKAEK